MVEIVDFIQEHASLVRWGGAMTGGLAAGLTAAGQVLVALVTIAVGSVAGIIIVYQIERWRIQATSPLPS